MYQTCTCLRKLGGKNAVLEGYLERYCGPQALRVHCGQGLVYTELL